MDIQEHLERLLNPNYWDGHRIEFDCDEPKVSEEIEGRLKKGLAKQALKEALGSIRTNFPSETYTKGQDFNAKEYPENTLVFFDKESLYFGGDKNDFRSDFYSELDLPPASTRLSSNLSEEGLEYIHIRNDTFSIDYIWCQLWGIVRTTNKKQNILALVPDDSVKKENHRTLIKASVLPMPPIIKIGETFHPQRRKLYRTNILQVCQTNPPEGGKKSRSLQLGALH